MRAWVYDRYGKSDVLQLRDVPAPRPGRGRILVRVRAAALNPKDGFFRRGSYRLVSGRSFPKQLGCDFAGEVVDAAEGFAAGERVWGMLDEWRFLRGTLSEIVAVRRRELSRMPARLSFEEAAGIPLAGSTALQALGAIAAVRTGDAVLVHGASGGVGAFAVQIARALGATVTTTCSAANLELCRELGAAAALDRERDDPFTAGRRYRVVLDTPGNLAFARARPALAAGGVFVTTVASPRLALDIARTALGHPRARLVIVRPRPDDLDRLGRWVESGALRPVIDRVLEMEDLAEGFRVLESRRARGKIIVRVAA